MAGNQNSNGSIKKQLIEIDYAATFEFFDNQRKHISGLRKLAIALLAIIVTCISGKIIQPSLVHELQVVALMIIVMFAFIELIERTRIELMHELAVQNEKLFFMGSDDVIMKDYKFLHTYWENIRLFKKIKTLFRCVVNYDFLLWNILMTIFCLKFLGKF